MPGEEIMPSTLRRSPKQAQKTWVKAHDGAVRTYGEGQRANRTAYAALKRTYEKVGDRWKPKQRRGPSDEQASRGGAGKPERPTAGGVDTHASKQHLYNRAKELGVPGRSSMSKKELINALQRKSAQRTRQARQG